MIIRLNGTIAPDNRVSIRTISHTLPHLQRAIDKLVLFEKFGEIKKHSALPNMHYVSADLYLDNFEEGSLKIPLLGELMSGVGTRLNQFLSEPYQKAMQDVQTSTRPILEQLEIVKNNINQENVIKVTQKDLIAQGKKLDRYYAQTAFLKDINTMLSPLRAKSAENDTITLTNNTTQKTADYEFNSINSKSFGKIVRERRLSDPVIYTGKLEGLKNVASSMFPCVGNFISDETNKEMKLLISTVEGAQFLNKYNISNQSISIWACPLAIYESFDQLCGDIVFVSFIG